MILFFCTKNGDLLSQYEKFNDKITFLRLKFTFFYAKSHKFYDKMHKLRLTSST
jgi:hypothetical protein